MTDPAPIKVALTYAQLIDVLSALEGRMEKLLQFAKHLPDPDKVALEDRAEDTEKLYQHFIEAGNAADDDAWTASRDDYLASF